jgi:hypothetical protein
MSLSANKLEEMDEIVPFQLGLRYFVLTRPFVLWSLEGSVDS